MREINIYLFNKLINIRSDVASDIANIEFIFRKYCKENMSNNKKADIYFLLKNNKKVYPKKNILSCFYYNQNQNIFYKLKNESIFKKWKSKNTFLPPIDTILFRNKFLILHGVGLYKNGHSFIFLGNNYSGKSIILLYGIKHGYKSISDDLIFYDINKGEIIPYFKPLGIRSTAKKISEDFSILYDSLEEIDHRDFYDSNNKFNTRIFHLEDYFPNSFIEFNVKIDNIFMIDSFSKKKLSFDERIELIEKGCCSSNIDEALKFENIININQQLNKIEYIKGKGALDELFQKI